MQRQMNESTFGLEAHQADMDQEFDFESNNKLFDKKVMQEVSFWGNSKLFDEVPL